MIEYLVQLIRQNILSVDLVLIDSQSSVTFRLQKVWGSTHCLIYPDVTLESIK